MRGRHHSGSRTVGQQRPRPTTFTETRIASGEAPPTAPSALVAAANGTTKIDLSWTDNSDNELDFSIERWDGAAFVEIIVTGDNATSAIDTGRSEATNYIYRMRAEGAGGYSAYTANANAYTALAAPTGPAVAAVNTTALNVSWTDVSGAETSYGVERYNGSVFVEVSNSAANATSFVDTGLSEATNYIYRIRAKATGVNSAYTSNANSYTALTAPTGPAATAVNSTAINVSWTDASGAETGYGVERYNGAAFVEINTTAANATNFVDTGLTAETNYIYRIRALSSGVNSTYTANVNATTASALSEDITDASFALKFDEYWDNFTGITFGPGNYFKKDTATSQFDIGGNENYILEILAGMPLGYGAAGVKTLFNTIRNGGSYNGIECWFASATSFVFYHYADSGAGFGTTITVPDIFDGTLHLISIRATRSGNFRLYFDNVAVDAGGVSMAAISGLALTDYGNIRIGVGEASTNAWEGTIYEVAFGKGVTTLGSRGPGSGVTPYDYLSDSTTGLVAHWKMNEASGDIVDSKNGITLTAVGSPTYSVAGAGKAAAIYDEINGVKLNPKYDPYNFVYQQGYNTILGGANSWLDPGINFGGAGTGGGFVHTDAVSALNLAANESYTVEYFIKTQNAPGFNAFWTWVFNAARNNEAYMLGAIYLNSFTELQIWERFDTSGVIMSFTVPDIFDGGLHKIRVSSDRSALVHTTTVYVDGVSCGGVTDADSCGDTFTSGRVGANNYQAIQLGDGYNAGAVNQAHNKTPGTLMFFKYSKSLTNMGGPGGG